MLQRRYKAYFAGGMLSALLLAAPALANDASPKAQAPKKMEKLGESLAAPAIVPGLAGSFLSGRFARHEQDIDEAAKYLGETLERDPDNRPLIHETMRMNLLSGHVDRAISYAHRLEDEAAGDPLISMILMIEQLKKGDYAKAEALVKATPQDGLYGVVKPVILHWLKIGSGQLVGQADMQKTIEKSGFFAPFLTYHQALMNDVLGNDALARDSYQKASADAAITPYRVVEAVANYDQRQGQWREAQAVYDRYSAENPDSTLLPDPVMASDKEVPPLVGSAQEGIAELFFTTASILFGEETSQETFLYLRLALALRPQLPPAQLMLANLYEQMEDYPHAIATYDAIAPGNVFYRRGQIRKALNLEAMGRPDDAIALLEKLSNDKTRDNSADITRGDMLRDAEKFEAAAGAYTDAIARVEPLKDSDWPLLYARGISFERAGEWAKAEADFKRALVLEPNQPDVLNYLAYSWLVLNQNVTQARDYLEIAASARPEDGHILDSLGWAYYLSGDFANATAQLEKAAELMPDDPTVNDHLGDAYWRVGRETEAKFQWQRALNFKPAEAEAQLIRSKIDHGLSPFMDQQSAQQSQLGQKTAALGQ
jgi:tetratricopeptide (TPR) repeat protein